MSSEKNITMRQFNGTDYDYLYPRTAVGQISGLSDNYYNKNESNGLYLRTDGSNAMSGNINANNHYITNVVTGSSGRDAANKSYVDNLIGNTLYSVNIGYNGNVNGTYSASSLVVGSNQFNFQNALGVMVTAQLSCTFGDSYGGFMIGNANCYVNRDSGRKPPSGTSLDINAFFQFEGLDYYYTSSRPFYGGFSYVTQYVAGVTSYANRVPFYSTGSSSADSIPLNFVMPVNAVGLYTYVVGNNVTIHSGFARIDVIYHR